MTKDEELLQLLLSRLVKERMDRREFLVLSGSTAAWHLANKFLPWSSIGSAAVDRLSKWKLNPTFWVEWRYAAGRIIDGSQDFGFIISISNIDVPLGPTSQQFLVQRQDFTGAKTFTANVYDGTLTYDSSATYIFEDNTAQELIRWQWDKDAQIYNLTVNTPELTLQNVVLIPQGDLIPEGGDGYISVGQLGSIAIDSEYHADWTTIEIGSAEKGTARVDIQGLFPAPGSSGLAATFSRWFEQGPSQHSIEPGTISSLKAIKANESGDYDHRWFAIAVELDNGTPAWVSAWKIVDEGGPFWCVTIALGTTLAGGTWQVFSVTEEDEGTLVAPLEVATLGWQDLPPEAGSEKSTGMQWRLTAGDNQPNDLLDVTITVLPGQIGTSNKLVLSSWLEEAVGTEIEGTILGQPISSVKVVVAESSTEICLSFLPLISK